MGNTQPTEKQLSRLMQSKDDGPVVMINLLKFKRDDFGTTNESMISYNSYMLATAPFLKDVGGKLLYMGEHKQVFIGDSTDEWDLYLLVEYPSPQAFIEMISHPGYVKVHSLRENALENSALLVTAPSFNSLDELKI